MAPSKLGNAALEKRYYCNGNYYSYSYHCNNYSTWNNWGRWVALAVIVVAALLLAFAFSCYNTRRRRRRGLAPMYGTGWIPYTAKPQYANNTGYYNSNQPYNGDAPAPPYEPPVGNQQTGNTYNSNAGYYGGHGGGYGAEYGGQQNGIELQQPQNTYNPQRGGEPVYEAPQGPPPGKGNHIAH